MVLSPTRKLFVDYVAFSRRGDAGIDRLRKDAVKDWTNQLNTGQRRNFVVARENVLYAVAARDRARENADDAAYNANAHRTAVPTNWDYLTSTAEAAAGSHRNLLAHQQILVGALTLFMLTAFQQNLHLRARNRSRTELVAANVEFARVQAEVNRLRNDADFPPVPPRADGRFKMPETSISARRLAARKRARRQAFRGGAVPIPQQPGLRWEGAWMITGGGMSTTGIWVSLDANDEVADRIVRKDTTLRRWQWVNAEYWDGDVRDRSRRRPMEAACQLQMGGVPNRSTKGLMVPELRTLRVDDAEKVYTMYMNYCPHGDLLKLIRRFRANNDHFPEPFLWHVFLALAEAGLAMETGGQNTNLPSWWHWLLDRGAQQIVHRDLKPSNIFLDLKDPVHFKDYPTVQLGDFGLSCKTWRTDPLNPHILIDGGGTTGFKAPEMRSYVDRATLQPIDRFQLLSHTNVWGFGMIMYCLVSLTVDPPQKDWLGDGDQDVPNVTADSRWPYGSELLDMIQDCLAYLPSARPSFGSLIKQIEAYLDEGGQRGGGLAFGMRNVEEYGDDDIRDTYELSYFPVDAYKVGMDRGQLPRDRG
ncbi:hypothetical protein LTR85_005430 [Meristemomyces frigidus]|nr:hypothetical protein LTR85_005430 [Meristemomyces frigidus]